MMIEYRDVLYEALADKERDAVDSFSFKDYRFSDDSRFEVQLETTHLHVTVDELKELSPALDRVYLEMVDKSIQERLFFIGCPADVFIEQYEQAKDNALRDEIDADEVDFIRAVAHFFIGQDNAAIGEVRKPRWNFSPKVKKQYERSIERSYEWMKGHLLSKGITVQQKFTNFDKGWTIKVDKVAPILELKEDIQEGSDGIGENDDSVAFRVALLNEIGFFGDKSEKGMGITKQYTLAAKILDCNMDTVRKNHYSLDLKKEGIDRRQYTAWRFIKEAKRWKEIHLGK